MLTPNTASDLARDWGPSLTILLATLIIFSFLYITHRPLERSPETHTKNDAATEFSGELTTSLSDAIYLNSFRTSDASDPSVRLEEVVRFNPSEYQDAAHAISRSFQKGNVLSIDLGSMDPPQAARLVDFCSGMVFMGSGWIFRVTDHVLVLSPHS